MRIGKYTTQISAQDRAVIATRSMNDGLYELSQSLITLPFKRVRMTGFNRTYHSVEYLYAILNFDVEWIINMDEDCFVFDNDRLIGIVRFMKENGYDFCGIPDGGSCIHRFHNPVAMNAFFNIFNVRKISNAFRNSKISQIDKTRYISELERFTPYHLLKKGFKYDYNNFEPYYPLFFFLLLKGFKPLFLPSVELEDGITTELRDHNNGPFLLHTWFTREYGSDTFHTKRIGYAYEFARKNHKAESCVKKSDFEC
jgi:hypothetical protein